MMSRKYCFIIRATNFGRENRLEKTVEGILGTSYGSMHKLWCSSLAFGLFLPIVYGSAEMIYLDLYKHVCRLANTDAVKQLSWMQEWFNMKIFRDYYMNQKYAGQYLKQILLRHWCKELLLNFFKNKVDRVNKKGNFHKNDIFTSSWRCRFYVSFRWEVLIVTSCCKIK